VDQIALFQKFCKEVILWNTLSHPNVLKLAGVQGDMEKGQFITVSEWMAHGNIIEYIKNNHVNRLELVRDFTSPTTSFIKMQRQLHGAAQGLKYLHGSGLTHGDLKGVGVSSFHDRFFFFTLKRQISSCPTARLLVPASQTSVL
jgi:serine/threonine protein kinase